MPEMARQVLKPLPVFFLNISIYINNLYPPGLEDPARVLSGILAGKGNLMLAAGCLRDFLGRLEEF